VKSDDDDQNEVCDVQARCFTFVVFKLATRFSALRFWEII
jgi:hypothetical protein